MIEERRDEIEARREVRIEKTEEGAHNMGKRRENGEGHREKGEQNGDDRDKSI